MQNIRDMLAPPAAAEAPRLVIRDGGPGVGTFVQDLTSTPVTAAAEVYGIMRTGYKNRTTFATNMNEHSSRSHCLLTVSVSAVQRTTGTTMRGKLHLIDLAGSERVSRSGATGDRLKEAQAINKSLSALGDVIAARVEKRGHVPFRNSTLTYLLQDSLSGDSKTLMFLCLSPALVNAEESFCSLNFAARVRNVELGKASKHVSGGSTSGGGGCGAGTPGAGSASGEGDDSGGGDYIGGGDEGDSGTPASPALAPTPTPAATAAVGKAGGSKAAPPPPPSAGAPSAGRAALTRGGSGLVRK